jgi:hypothetical protein
MGGEMNKSLETMTGIPDETVFEEVAQRLKTIYQREKGVPFVYGSFDFIFHDGKFQSIEERPRCKRYLSSVLRRDKGKESGKW